MEIKISKKSDVVKTVLTTIFVSSLLISNVIASKQLLLPFGITMTGGIIIFPITYILSDVFSEVYGYKWSRFTCYLAFAMNLVMVIVFQIAISTPGPDYWSDQQAFQTVLGNAPRILFASLIAFVVGDLANDLVFKQMKKKYPNSLKGFKLRAIISSIVGEIVDSGIFFPLVFVGQMPFAELLAIGITELGIKIAYEIAILPLTSFIARKISVHETKRESDKEVTCKSRCVEGISIENLK